MSVLIVRNGDDARVALTRFPRHYKLISWLALHVLELPTLAGIVFDSWSVEVEAYVHAFADSLGVDRLLLRSDKADETGKYPVGGFLVNMGQIVEHAEPFLSEDRVVFLMEPRSPFRDEYSLGVVLWPGEPVRVEMVGPGFDAGDLKRGRTSPHESFELARRDAGLNFEDRILDHHVINSEGYRASWNRRLKQTAELLVSEGAEPSDGSLKWVRNELNRRSERLLLTSGDGYRPINLDLVQRVVEDIEGLPEGLQHLDLPGEPLMVSMSYFGTHYEPIYWDVVWPDLKYQGANSRSSNDSP
jgi:hypothetical protein